MKVGLDCRVVAGNGVGRLTRCIALGLRDLAPQFDLTLFGDRGRIAEWCGDCRIVDVPSVLVSERDLYALPKYVDREGIETFVGMQYYTSPFLDCRQVRLLHDIYPFLPGVALPSREDWVARYGLSDVEDLERLTASGIEGYISLDSVERMRRMYRVLYEMAIAKSETVLTVSAFSALGIRTWFPNVGDKLRVWRPFVDPRLLSCEQRPTWPWRRRAFRLLHVGNLEPRKNHLELIRALILLRQASIDVDLVLIGRPTGNYRRYVREVHRLVKLVDETWGCVQLLNALPDRQLSAIYRAAELVVLPSTFEGFGLPALEALAFGVPLLATHLPPFVEIAGSAVKWCAADSYSIAAAISGLVANPTLRARLKEEGPRRAVLFDMKSSIGSLARILEMT